MKRELEQWEREYFEEVRAERLLFRALYANRDTRPRWDSPAGLLGFAMNEMVRESARADYWEAEAKRLSGHVQTRVLSWARRARRNAEELEWSIAQATTASNPSAPKPPASATSEVSTRAEPRTDPETRMGPEEGHPTHAEAGARFSWSWNGRLTPEQIAWRRRVEAAREMCA